MRAIRAGRWTGLAMLVLVTAVSVGCSRGPDATALRSEVQGKLDQRFKPGLFGLDQFRRQGSAPLPAAESGTKRLAVYFNATLKLNQGYDFGDWEGLSPATLAHVLGATEKGIYGLKTGENRPGEVIQVYGSSTYEWSGDRWQSVEATTAGVAKPAEPGNAAPASQSKQLIDRLAAMVEIPPPGVPPADEAMIREELDRALRAIVTRRERRKHVYTFASGPEAGEYYPIAQALVDRVIKLDQALKVRNAATAGSVENVDRSINFRHVSARTARTNRSRVQSVDRRVQVCIPVDTATVSGWRSRSAAMALFSIELMFESRVSSKCGQRMGASRAATTAVE